jgi:hypothetical protein
MKLEKERLAEEIKRQRAVLDDSFNRYLQNH